MAQYIVYKITHKNPNIDFLYLGYTGNFETKYITHKCFSNDTNNMNTLYVTIRKYGGWSCVNMEIINSYDCFVDMKQSYEENLIILKPTIYQ
jgi:hypothetical protein